MGEILWIEDIVPSEDNIERRILPALPGEYDRWYAVDRGSLTDDDIKILLSSGYEFIHIPVFGMYGHTKSKYTLNPHTKSILDAGEADDETISFKEFLRLFDEKDT